MSVINSWEEMKVLDISEKLKAIRKSKNLSVYKLSKISGISETHIRDLERGDRNPSLDTISRLANTFGLSLPDLLSENEEILYLTDNEKELVKYFRMMPKDSADSLLAFLKTFA